MIIQGRHGSMVSFWKDKLMFGFPLGHNKVTDYQQQANMLMIDSLEKGSSIKEQIIHYQFICDHIYKRKMKGSKICRLDVQTFCCAVLSLIKFKVIDEDDVILMCEKKRSKRPKRFN